MPGDRIRNRGLLTRALAVAIVQAVGDSVGEVPLRHVRVHFIDEKGHQLAVLPLDRAMHALAFDEARNGVQDWSRAIEVKIGWIGETKEG